MDGDVDRHDALSLVDDNPIPDSGIFNGDVDRNRDVDCSDLSCSNIRVDVEDG